MGDHYEASSFTYSEERIFDLKDIPNHHQFVNHHEFKVFCPELLEDVYGTKSSFGSHHPHTIELPLDTNVWLTYLFIPKSHNNRFSLFCGNESQHASIGVRKRNGP